MVARAVLDGELRLAWGSAASGGQGQNTMLKPVERGAAKGWSDEAGGEAGGLPVGADSDSGEQAN